MWVLAAPLLSASLTSVDAHSSILAMTAVHNSIYEDGDAATCTAATPLVSSSGCSIVAPTTSPMATCIAAGVLHHSSTPRPAKSQREGIGMFLNIYPNGI
jgi:hypothetical protein